MKILDKDVTGTILKVSEVEIYALTHALRNHVKATSYKGVKEDAQALLDVLDDAVYMKAPVLKKDVLPVMTHRMYLEGKVIDYSIDEINQGSTVIGTVIKAQGNITITRESALGKLVMENANKQDPPC